MRLSRILAAALLVGSVGAIQQAAAFSLDDQSANNGDGSPRFADPDEQGEAMTNPSGHSSFSLSGHSSSSGPYGSNADIAGQSVPSSAQLGAGDHGFNNVSHYGRH